MISKKFVRCSVMRADSATPSEAHGGILRRSREPIAEYHSHGADSGLRNMGIFLKPGGEILNNNVVVPTGFEPVFESRPCFSQRFLSVR